MKRRSKTIAQQCRYYEVDNIFEYMVSVYLNGNISAFEELYKELNRKDKKEFILYLFSEVASVPLPGSLSVFQSYHGHNSYPRNHFDNHLKIGTMEAFRFYQDRKVTCWERTHFEVTAENYEEAVALVKS